VDFVDFIREVRGGADKMLSALWKIGMGARRKSKAFNRKTTLRKAAKFGEKF
jgi:hypothetical protein